MVLQYYDTLWHTVYRSKVDFENLVHELTTQKDYRYFELISHEYHYNMGWNDININTYFPFCKAILCTKKKKYCQDKIDEVINDFLNNDYKIIMDAYVQMLKHYDKMIKL